MNTNDWIEQTTAILRDLYNHDYMWCVHEQEDRYKMDARIHKALIDIGADHDGYPDCLVPEGEEE